MDHFYQVYGTDDPRLAHLLKKVSVHDPSSLHGYNVALLGFPYDIGTIRNGGRPGGAGGPDAFRALLPKIGTLINLERNIDIRGLKVADLGNIPANQESLEDAHISLTETVKCVVAQGVIPFVVGGSNDQSYPNAKGYLEGLKAVGKGEPAFTAINVDAHLDVRPLTAAGLAHSGSPFRLLTQDHLFHAHKGQLIEFGSQGHACSAEHWSYVQQLPQGRIISISELKLNERKHGTSIPEQFEQVLNSYTTGEHVFLSFDIDAISSADCPGVSAPAPYGLSAEDACEICFIAGKSDKVKLVDVSEYNPLIETHRTGRLICFMFYHFLMGLKQRKC